jgi:hypothetical protein
MSCAESVGEMPIVVRTIVSLFVEVGRRCHAVHAVCCRRHNEVRHGTASRADCRAASPQTRSKAFVD